MNIAGVAARGAAVPIVTGDSLSYRALAGGVEAAGGLKKALFNAALEGKKYWLYRDNTLGHSVWDPLVFRKLAGRVGLDRCRLMLTGA